MKTIVEFREQIRRDAQFGRHISGATILSLLDDLDELETQRDEALARAEKAERHQSAAHTCIACGVAFRKADTHGTSPTEWHEIVDSILCSPVCEEHANVDRKVQYAKVMSALEENSALRAELASALEKAETWAKHAGTEMARAENLRAELARKTEALDLIAHHRGDVIDGCAWAALVAQKALAEPKAVGESQTSK